VLSAKIGLSTFRVPDYALVKAARKKYSFIRRSIQ
jgi:hypothetical protein